MTAKSRKGVRTFATAGVSWRRGLAGALAALIVASGAAWGQQPGFRGVDIFDAVCWGCHTNGEEGAPRVGDRDVWAKRAARGLEDLTQNALKGVGGMPPHGGNTSLTRLQIQRAIVYMVNASGGDWSEPLDPRPGSARSGGQLYQQYCALCHESGFDNAPRIGDRAAWLPRTRLGIDPMVRVAVRGHGAMPPRGGQANLTDEELRDAVIYMISAPERPAARGR